MRLLSCAGRLRRSIGRRTTATIAVFVLLVGHGPGFDAWALEIPGISDANRAPKPAAPSDSLAATLPKTIAIEDISRSAARTEIRLREIRRSIRTSVEMDRIVSELAGLRRNIETLQARTEDEALALQSRRHLSTLVGEWELQTDLTTEWETYLSRRVALLAAAQKELRDRAGVWQRTQDAASTASAPAAVRERAQVVLRAVNALEARVRVQLDEALELENTVSELDLIASDSRALVEVEIQERRSSLFELDAPPVWRWREARAGARPASGPRFELAEDVVRPLADFARLRGDRIRVHALLAIGIVIFAYLGRRRRGSWREAEPEIALFARLLDRPVSTAGLLVLLPTLWLYPVAPVVVYQMASLLAVPFIARLLPLLLPAHVVKPAFAMVVLFVLEPLPDVMASDPDVSRAVFLAETLVGLAISIYAVRQSRNRPGDPTARIARMAVLLFSIALLAGLAGARSLAILMLSGTIRSAYAGIFVYVAVLVLLGTWAFALRTPLLEGVRAVRARRDTLRTRGARLLAVAGAFVWAVAILHNFYLLGTARTALQAFVGHRWRLGTLDVAIGDVLAFFLVLYVAVLVSRMLRYVLEEDVFARLDLPRGVPGTISTLVRYALLAAGFTMALAAARIPLDRFTVLAGALGVGIGFGLQNIVNNFVSGLILAFERPVQVGDTVEVGTFLGQIRHIGVRASTIRTFEGAEVIIPNGTLISNDVVNWTLSDRTRRIEIAVGVAYGTDPSRVLALLQEEAAKHPGALKHPEPQALFRGFGESSLDFALRFWTGDFADWLRVQSEVTVAVHDRIRAEKIEIPFPQRDLHLRSVAPQARESLGGGGPGTAQR